MTSISPGTTGTFSRAHGTLNSFRIARWPAEHVSVQEYECVECLVLRAGSHFTVCRQVSEEFAHCRFSDFLRLALVMMLGGEKTAILHVQAFANGGQQLVGEVRLLEVNLMVVGLEVGGGEFHGVATGVNDGQVWPLGEQAE